MIQQCFMEKVIVEENRVKEALKDLEQDMINLVPQAYLFAFEGNWREKKDSASAMKYLRLVLASIIMEKVFPSLCWLRGCLSSMMTEDEKKSRLVNSIDNCINDLEDLLPSVFSLSIYEAGNAVKQFATQSNEKDEEEESSQMMKIVEKFSTVILKDE